MMIEEIREAMQSHANDNRSAYWRALSVLANGGVSEKQKSEALKRAARIANELAIDAESMDSDIQLLRERDALPDLAQVANDAERAARQDVEEASQLEADASAARARAEELTRRAVDKRRDAARVKESARDFAKRAHAVRRQLAARGCPAALAETLVEEQQRQLQHARRAVEVAEKELEAALEAHEKVLAHSSRPAQYGEPRTLRHVERRRRALDEARCQLSEIEDLVEREVAGA